MERRLVQTALRVAVPTVLAGVGLWFLLRQRQPELLTEGQAGPVGKNEERVDAEDEQDVEGDGNGNGDGSGDGDGEATEKGASVEPPSPTVASGEDYHHLRPAVQPPKPPPVPSPKGRSQLGSNEKREKNNNEDEEEEKKEPAKTTTTMTKQQVSPLPPRPPPPPPSESPVMVKLSPGRGRGLFSRDQQDAGSVVFKVRPAITLLFEQFGATRCLGCFSPVDHKLPKAGKAGSGNGNGNGNGGGRCGSCKRFAVCEACDRKLGLSQWHQAPGGECERWMRLPEKVRTSKKIDHLWLMVRYRASLDQDWGRRPNPAAAAETTRATVAVANQSSSSGSPSPLTERRSSSSSIAPSSAARAASSSPSRRMSVPLPPQTPPPPPPSSSSPSPSPSRPSTRKTLPRPSPTSGGGYGSDGDAERSPRKEGVKSLQFMQSNGVDQALQQQLQASLEPLARMSDLRPDVALQLILRLRTNAGHIMLPEQAAAASSASAKTLQQDHHHQQQQQQQQQQRNPQSSNYQTAVEAVPAVQAGCALSSNLSFLNHSCDPNAAAEVRDGYLHISTLKPVAANAELTISYTDLTAPVLERRRVLLDHYRFQCGCERCVRELAALRAVTTGGY